MSDNAGMKLKMNRKCMMLQFQKYYTHSICKLYLSPVTSVGKNRLFAQTVTNDITVSELCTEAMQHNFSSCIFSGNIRFYTHTAIVWQLYFRQIFKVVWLLRIIAISLMNKNCQCWHQKAFSHSLWHRSLCSILLFAQHNNELLQKSVEQLQCIPHSLTDRRRTRAGHKTGAHCGIIVCPKNHEILGPIPLGNNYYRREAVWFGILGPSFFLLETKKLAFQKSIKPFCCVNR